MKLIQGGMSKGVRLGQHPSMAQEGRGWRNLECLQVSQVDTLDEVPPNMMVIEMPGSE